MVWKRESEKCEHDSLWVRTQGLAEALPSCPWASRLLLLTRSPSIPKVLLPAWRFSG